MEGDGEKRQWPSRLWPGRLWPPSSWSELRDICCCKLRCEGGSENDGDQIEGVTMPLLEVKMPLLGNPGQAFDGSPMPGVQHIMQLTDGQRAPG